MEDSAPDSQTPSPSKRGRLHLNLLRGGCLIMGVFAVTEYLSGSFLSRTVLMVNVPVSLLILLGVVAILLACGAGVYLMRSWKLPLYRLRGILEETRRGDRSLEEFPKAMAGLTPLLEVLEEMLRDGRRMQAEIAQLNHEMSQRVAQRTNALERLAGKLQTQATRDALTGLFNRRMLEQCLDELVQRCVQDRQPLCLMMIDVDDFKMLNDKLGHAAGDALLRSVGQLIRSTIRQQDLGFRCGGDEFVIIMPQAGRGEGEALAKRLGNLVDAMVKPLTIPRKPRLSLGMSTLEDLRGIATGPEIMADADRRLYEVKAARKEALKAAGVKDRAA